MEKSTKEDVKESKTLVHRECNEDLCQEGVHGAYPPLPLPSSSTTIRISKARMIRDEKVGRVSTAKKIQDTLPILPTLDFLSSRSTTEAISGPIPSSARPLTCLVCLPNPQAGRPPGWISQLSHDLFIGGTKTTMTSTKAGCGW